jgi:DNA-binding NarL/FixJ family response regulator
MNIIIVDDNDPFREILKLYLEVQLKHDVIDQARSGEDFLTMKTIPEADIVLMDIAMGQLDGFETCKHAIFRFPQLKVIAITMHNELVFLIKLIESGFKGFVNKTDIFDHIQTAITEVHNGHLYFPDDILLKVREIN